MFHSYLCPRSCPSPHAWPLFCRLFKHTLARKHTQVRGFHRMDCVAQAADQRRNQILDSVNDLGTTKPAISRQTSCLFSFLCCLTCLSPLSPHHPRCMCVSSHSGSFSARNNWFSLRRNPATVLGRFIPGAASHWRNR